MFLTGRGKMKKTRYLILLTGFSALLWRKWFALLQCLIFDELIGDNDSDSRSSCSMLSKQLTNVTTIHPQNPLFFTNSCYKWQPNSPSSLPLLYPSRFLPIILILIDNPCFREKLTQRSKKRGVIETFQPFCPSFCLSFLSCYQLWKILCCNSYNFYFVKYLDCNFLLIPHGALVSRMVPEPYCRETIWVLSIKIQPLSLKFRDWFRKSGVGQFREKVC